MLSDIPGCKVVHEHPPPLIAELSDLLEGRMSSSALVELLRETRSPEALGGSCLSGESNQRLSFVIPALAEAFPDARYVWLVRDGRDAVSSFQHRLWYHPRERELRPGVVNSATHRLRGDRVGDLSAKEWEALDSFGRCCWYWGFTQRVISRETERLQLPVFCLRLEALDEELRSLLAFLDLDHPVPALQRSNVSRRRALAALRGPMPSHWWSKRQWQLFLQWCGDPMDRLYPGWRSGMQPGPWQTVAGPWYRAARAVYSHLSRATYPLRSRVARASSGRGSSRWDSRSDRSKQIAKS